MKDEDKLEVEKDGKVFFLRRSNRVTAALAEVDSDDDDDDIDEERMRRFLSEGILDEDNDEIDEDAEALKSVERKCPYCPDRFHNGIGLANHVRGHLNRVGVSYNVRHFISPEEVNAIEKKFSYQKKKKKGQWLVAFVSSHCVVRWLFFIVFSLNLDISHSVYQLNNQSLKCLFFCHSRTNPVQFGAHLSLDFILITTSELFM